MFGKNGLIAVVCGIFMFVSVFACTSNAPAKDCFYIDNKCKFDVYVSVSECNEYEPQSCYSLSSGRALAVENILGYYTIWTRSESDSVWYSTTIYVRNNATLAISYKNGRYSFEQEV